MKNNGLFTQRNNGYVYIAEDDIGNVKVGGTHNVQKRLRQLRRKHPSLKLVAQIKAEHFMYLEKFLHIHLKDGELIREWYCDLNIVIKETVDFLKRFGEVFGAYEIHFLPIKRKEEKP